MASRNVPRRPVVYWAPLLGGNPYQQLLDDALRRRGAETRPMSSLSIRDLLLNRTQPPATILHLHWIEYLIRRPAPRGLLRPSMMLRATHLTVTLILARLRRVRTVWTLHNIAPHNMVFPHLERLLFRLTYSLVDEVIVHSDRAAEAVQATYGGSHVTVACHGHYVGIYPPSQRGGANTRAALDIPQDAVVLLAFGFVKSYKHIPELIRAVRSVDRPDLHLLVAGSCPHTSLRSEIHVAAECDGRIHLLLDYIDEKCVADLHLAADAGVLHYIDDSFSSGALMLALSLGLPVIVPAGSTAADLVSWPLVQPFANDDLASTLRRVQRVDPALRLDARTAALSHGWQEMADAVLGP